MPLQQMPYMLVLKRFKILWHWAIVRYYRNGDRGSTGLIMASTLVSVILYVIDILTYIDLCDCGGVGELNCE